MSAELQAAASEPPALVVFGRDDSGKPHGSVFIESEAALAEKAAGLMGMRVLAIRTDAERALAARLPKGKVFASGKGFVPFIKATLFQELETACPATDSGSAVSGATPADAKAPASPAENSRSNGSTPPPARQPGGWGEVSAGAIVLARPSYGNAEWYECLVTAAKGDHFTLRLCDFPERPLVHRRRMELALMHPKHRPEPPLEIEPSPPAA